MGGALCPDLSRDKPAPTFLKKANGYTTDTFAVDPGRHQRNKDRAGAGQGLLPARGLVRVMVGLAVCIIESALRDDCLN